MPTDEPSWWYRPTRGIAAFCLQPIALLYGRIAMGRFRARRPYRSRLPVVCIGNLVAGGTGKTPLAMAIASGLLHQGFAPAFLSRGYGGRLIGPHQVDPARDAALDIGDEPLLLAQVAPTIISRDRAAGARLIEQTSATHILMDDGLQNPGLAKDLVIAVIDGARGLGNGCVIPAGPLRAPLEFQVGLIDAIVVCETEPEASPLPQSLTSRFTGPTLRVRRALAVDGVVLGAKPWIAFAGIGKPDDFFAMLQKAGARLAGRVAFADHHTYTKADAMRLIALAEHHGAGLITTEKDRARLPAGKDLLGLMKDTVVAPRLRLSMSAVDEQVLLELLARKLAKP